MANVRGSTRGFHHFERCQRSKKVSIVNNTLERGNLRRAQSGGNPDESVTNALRDIKNKIARPIYIQGKRSFSKVRVTRKEVEGESIDEFVKALRLLAHKCNFSAAEMKNQLKDQLISGTSLKAVRYELLKSPDLEWEQAVELAKTVEIADAKAESMLSPQTSKQEVNAIWHGNRRSSSNPQQRFFKTQWQQGRERGFGQRRGTTTGKRKFQHRASSPSTPAASIHANDECYCCGGKGHRSYECSLRNKYCSECGKQGHIYKTCVRNRNRMPAANQNFRRRTDDRERKIKRGTAFRERWLPERTECIYVYDGRSWNDERNRTDSSTAGRHY